MEFQKAEGVDFYLSDCGRYEVLVTEERGCWHGRTVKGDWQSDDCALDLTAMDHCRKHEKNWVKRQLDSVALEVAMRAKCDAETSAGRSIFTEEEVLELREAVLTSLIQGQKYLEDQYQHSGHARLEHMAQAMQRAEDIASKAFQNYLKRGGLDERTLV